MTTICESYNQVADWYDKEHLLNMEQKKTYLDQVVKHIDPNGKILDLGCGTGKPIGQYFIELGYDYTGVDGSHAMIEKCKASFPGAIWHHADMREITFEREFDAVILWDSLFHLNHDDQVRMLDVITKYLKPGGMLLFNSGRFFDEHFSSWGKPEQTFYHASLDKGEYELLLTKNTTFKIIACTPLEEDMLVWFAKYKG